MDNTRKVSGFDRFFGITASGSTLRTEITAGLTTFFSMAYILFVNPNILSQAGMEWGAVYLATIIASVIGTLVMGLVANVPYAQAPGMGLNAFSPTPSASPWALPGSRHCPWSSYAA